ncbi:hypothetical protein Poly51_14630 [Rubripirellula tenax]|uniref:Uncharacterized protein n=1 Tax=Rubripirellula tenax TaxID=2528015 RepID=A0A5C6FER4_9BACT|nr:hypothetical protein [Rubripirellula tenax]TWU58684.1 hypothetical protein Poly51_14630 [Rubripirellula tenax]
MHLLTCPECQVSVPVATSQAGGRTQCSGCQAILEIPTLGQLRQLPVAEGSVNDDDAYVNPASSGGSIAFGIVGLLATAALVVAAYTGIRWSLIDVPVTTDLHIAEYQNAYTKLPAAQLIREYEQMEEFGIDVALPYTYVTMANTKSDWGWTSATAGGVALLAVLAMLAIGVSGRKRK